jgi:hypothetical protein
VYAYNKVTTSLADAITAWIQKSKDGRFGAAVAGSFETYPDWQAGWTLCEMKFDFRGKYQTPVYMAFQNNLPNNRWIMYFDPDTGKFTSWLPYN